MSFSEAIKKQLCAAQGCCGSCDRAELAGILDFAGKNIGSTYYVTTENQDTQQRLRQLLKNIFNIDAEYAFNENKHSYSFAVSMDSAPAKPDISAQVPECCTGAYLRGAFLGGGSICDPRKGYHLEFDTKQKPSAEYLCRLLALDNIPVKVTTRKNHYIVYTKSSGTAADILGKMKLYTAVMELYNVSAEKEMRNDINRRVNCETANLDKTVKASVRHIEAIKKIERTKGLGILPDYLKQTALLRAEYPEDSLTELAARLGMGKSGVNHRLAKIIEIAKQV